MRPNRLHVLYEPERIDTVYGISLMVIKELDILFRNAGYDIRKNKDFKALKKKLFWRGKK